MGMKYAVFDANTVGATQDLIIEGAGQPSACILFCSRAIEENEDQDSAMLGHCFTDGINYFGNVRALQGNATSPSNSKSAAYSNVAVGTPGAMTFVDQSLTPDGWFKFKDKAEWPEDGVALDWGVLPSSNYKIIAAFIYANTVVADIFQRHNDIGGVTIVTPGFAVDSLFTLSRRLHQNINQLSNSSEDIAFGVGVYKDNVIKQAATAFTSSNNVATGVNWHVITTSYAAYSRRASGHNDVVEITSFRDGTNIHFTSRLQAGNDHVAYLAVQWNEGDQFDLGIFQHGGSGTGLLNYTLALNSLVPDFILGAFSQAPSADDNTLQSTRPRSEGFSWSFIQADKQHSINYVATDDTFPIYAKSRLDTKGLTRYALTGNTLTPYLVGALSSIAPNLFQLNIETNSTGGDVLQWAFATSSLGQILDLDFETGDFSQVSTVVADISSLVIVTTPGLIGTNYKGTFLFDGSDNLRYLQPDLSYTESDEITLLLTFDTTSLSAPQPMSFQPFRIMSNFNPPFQSPPNNALTIFLTDFGEGLVCGFGYGRDEGTASPAEARPVLQHNLNTIRMYYRKATSTISADGFFSCWLNGTHIFTDENVNNYGIFSEIFETRFGICRYTGDPSSFAGSISLDEIQIYNDGSLPEFPVITPILTSPDKVVAFNNKETSISGFDLLGSGLLEIQLTVTAGELSLTLFGSVIIVAGSQNSSSITIEGTSNVELIATLNSLKYIYATNGQQTLTVKVTNANDQFVENTINILVAIIALDDLKALLSWRSNLTLPNNISSRLDAQQLLENPRNPQFLLVQPLVISPEAAEFIFEVEALDQSLVQQGSLLFDALTTTLSFETILNSSFIILSSIELADLNNEFSFETLLTDVINGSLQIEGVAEVSFETDVDQIIKSSLVISDMVSLFTFMTSTEPFSVPLIVTPDKATYSFNTDLLIDDIIQASLLIDDITNSNMSYTVSGPSLVNIVELKIIKRPLGVKFLTRTKNIVFSK